MSQKGGCTEALLALFTTCPEDLMYYGDGMTLKNRKCCLSKGNRMHGFFQVPDLPLRCQTSMDFLGAELSHLVDLVSRGGYSSEVSSSLP